MNKKMDIDTTRLSRWSASYRTQYFVRRGERRMVTVPSPLTLVLLVVPAGILWKVLLPDLSEPILDWKYFSDFLTAALFTGVVLAMAGTDVVPFHVDLERGIFWKGFTSPSPRNTGKSRRAGRISDIAGLQVLGVTVPRRRTAGGRMGSRYRSGFNSYEFNLVLKDRSRINVLVTGSKKDAEKLAAFLKVPLWSE